MNERTIICPKCGYDEAVAIDNYTVVLLYPDYLAQDYGEDTYLAHVRATTSQQAARFARDDAVQAQDDPTMVHDPIDFAIIAVFKGKHEDLNPGI